MVMCMFGMDGSVVVGWVLRLMGGYEGVGVWEWLSTHQFMLYVQENLSLEETSVSWQTRNR